MVSVIVVFAISNSKEEEKEICSPSYTNEHMKQYNRLYPDTICGDNPIYEFNLCNPSQSIELICDESFMIQDCTEYEKYLIYGNNPPLNDYVELAKKMEIEHQCSGICNVCPHYIYNDCTEQYINHKSCDEFVIEALKEFDKDLSNILNYIDVAVYIGSISIICGVISVIILIFMISACCTKRTVKQLRTNSEPE